MPAGDLDSELRATAKRTAEAILREARATADQLTEEAERSIGNRREQLLEAKEAEYTAEARRAVAAEKHAAMELTLMARTRLVDRVLQRVRAQLPEVAGGDAYRSGLPGELERALAFVEGEEIAVRCSTDLVEAVRDTLRAQPGVEVEPDAGLSSGFIVAGDGGAVLVDGRLETRVDRLASALAIEIHWRLGVD